MAVVVMETAGNRYKVHRVLTPDGETFKVLKQANAEVNTVGGITEGAKSSGEVAPTINSASDNSINNPAENVNSEKWVPYYELSAQELVQAQIEGRYDENTKMVLLEMPNSQAVENGEAEFAVSAMPTKQRSSMGYDYSKSFSEQIDDYKIGRIPKGDSLIVGATPKVYQTIGFNAIPMTINTTHVGYALNGTKDVDHYTGEALLKQLPESIKEPVAVFVSQTHGTTSVIALLNFTVNGKQTVAPIVIDGYGKNNSIVIDSNAITSLYGKNTALNQLYQAAQNEANGKFALLYVNKKEAVSLLQRAGHQLSGTLMPHDGFYHSIRENGSPVKPKFESVTETQQFKRWFGYWKTHPNTASRIVNTDGTPRIVYHGTNAEFNAFDKRKAKNGVFGKGFYFATTKGRASAYGSNKILEVYLSVRTPYIVADSLGFTFDDYQNMQKQFGIGDKITDQNVAKILQQQGYDGIIAEDGNGNVREIVVFEPTQIKSATSNIGTFDGDNPDIEFALGSEPVDTDLDLEERMQYYANVPEYTPGMERNSTVAEDPDVDEMLHFIFQIPLT